MKEIRIKQFDIDEVDEITLLSIEETNSIDKKILDCGEWWWLRSPGIYPDHAALVYDNEGDIFEYGSHVYDDFNAVRPAFRITNLKLKIGEPIRIGKTWCTVINKNLALADYPVCKHRFDLKSNDWENSELKRFINSEEFISLL